MQNAQQQAIKKWRNKGGILLVLQIDTPPFYSCEYSRQLENYGEMHKGVSRHTVNREDCNGELVYSWDLLAGLLIG